MHYKVSIIIDFNSAQEKEYYFFVDADDKKGALIEAVKQVKKLNDCDYFRDKKLWKIIDIKADYLGSIKNWYRKQMKS